MNSSLMSKRNLRLAFMILAAGAIAWGLIRLFIIQIDSPKIPYLPDEQDIAKATAQVNDLEKEMGIPSVPEFTVPSDAVPIILRAFKPVELLPRTVQGWEKQGVKATPRLGDITIQTKSGKSLTITLYDIGKTRAGFTVNGISCVRGGQFKPVFICTEYQSYEDESELIIMIIREIYKEVQTNEKSKDLAVLLERLQRSRGEKPPESR